MSFADDMENSTRDYAADLRGRGYLDVAVFRYDTPLDNREPYRRDHRTAFGWAVRYTSSPEMDAQVHAGTMREQRGLPVQRFHDRSVTVFTGPADLVRGCRYSDAWLTQGMLTQGHAGILADFAGEGAVPMYTAAWSPNQDTPGVRPENIPAVPSVIMKRFPAREAGDNYTWQVGPTRMYHLIMTPAGS